jgi:hypothetical protein
MKHVDGHRHLTVINPVYVLGAKKTIKNECM